MNNCIEKEYIYFNAIKNEFFFVNDFTHEYLRIHILLRAWPYPGCTIIFIGEL